MVPTSQHLSLTGSKFGMRSFGVLSDNESTMTGRRSPFEWWNTMLERSQSRQDQMSQFETASFTTRPGSRGTTIASRRDFRTSTPTLTPEKSKEPIIRTWELTIPPAPSPSPPPSNQQTINFSRAFIPRTPSSPLTQRSQVTLSRISETSPHHSMISTTAIQLPNRSSYYSAIHPLDHTPFAGQISDARPSASTPLKTMTLAVPPSHTPTSKRPANLNQDRPNFPSSNLTQSQQSNRLSIPLSAQKKPLPYPKEGSNSAPSLAVPKPVAHRGPSLNLDNHLSSKLPYRNPNQSKLDLTHRNSTGSRTSITASRKSSSSISGPSGIIYDSQVPDFWSTTTDLRTTLRLGDDNDNKTDADNASGSASGDKGQRDNDNIMGIVTVPGKNSAKVLRKKSRQRKEINISMA